MNPEQERLKQEDDKVEATFGKFREILSQRKKNKDNKKVTFGIMNKIHVLFQFSMTSFSHTTDNEKRQPPLSMTDLTRLTTVGPDTVGSFCSA